MKDRPAVPQKQLRPETQADVTASSPSGRMPEAERRTLPFGKEPCIADAFYAPVVTRFRTYSIPVSGRSKAYCDAIWAWPPLQAWLADAQRETLRAKFHED